jgi:hypothetical protein
MRRTCIGSEAFLLRLSWGNADAVSFLGACHQAAARFFGIVARVRPVNTA